MEGWYIAVLVVFVVVVLTVLANMSSKRAIREKDKREQQAEHERQLIKIAKENEVKKAAKDDKVKRLKEEGIVVAQEFALYDYSYMLVSESSRLIIIDEKKYSFDSIIGAEFDMGDKPIGYSAITTTDDGFERAVVGGLLAGTAGAVVGAATATHETKITPTDSGQRMAKVHIYTNTVLDPIITVSDLESECRKIYAMLLAIINQNKANGSASN